MYFQYQYLHIMKHHQHNQGKRSKSKDEARLDTTDAALVSLYEFHLIREQRTTLLLNEDKNAEEKHRVLESQMTRTLEGIEELPPRKKALDNIDETGDKSS